MQSRVGSNGHVSAAEVIVYGAHKTNDVQVIVLLCHLVCNPSWRNAQTILLQQCATVPVLARNEANSTPHFIPNVMPNVLHNRLPFCTSSSSRLLHSLRKMLAPVRLPSPPHTQRLVMPFFTRLKAAEILPSRVVKDLQRALPITVPPYKSETKKNKALLQNLEIKTQTKLDLPEKTLMQGKRSDNKSVRLLLK